MQVAVRRLDGRPWAHLGRIALLVGVYFGSGVLGLLIDPVSGFATFVWPSTGISLAALVLFGWQLWPGIALGALLVNLWAGAPVIVAGGIAAGNLLEAVVGAYALQRTIRFRPSLVRVPDAIGLIVLAALLSTVVSATIGVLSLIWGGVIAQADFAQTWRAWWLGDVMGNLVVAPLLLTWGARSRRALRLGSRREAIALLLLVMLAAAYVFVGWPRAAGNVMRMPYLPFPLIMWAALRFGPRGASMATFLVSAIAICGTVLGLDPFHHATVHEDLLALQGFMGVGAATSMILGAAVAEREAARDALRRAADVLEARVTQRTAQLSGREAQLAEAQQLAQLGSWEWDLGSGRVGWSHELFRIYGLSPSQFSGTHQGFLERVHADDRTLLDERMRSALRERKPLSVEHRIVRADGSVRILEARGQVHLDAEGRVVGMRGMSRDVTVERAKERTIEASLREKEILLREIHHRVKNNLQIISSLLALQGRALQNRQLSAILDECQNRIRSIGLVHESLHESADMGAVDLQSYLQLLTSNLLRTYGATGEVIAVHVFAEEALAIDAAIPCGLIVNELVSNALKHAFPAGRHGIIRVSLSHAPGAAQSILEVADDGIGLPAAVDCQSATTLGLKLVSSLARQLGGAIEIEREGGTRFRIRFARS